MQETLFQEIRTEISLRTEETTTDGVRVTLDDDTLLQLLVSQKIFVAVGPNKYCTAGRCEKASSYSYLRSCCSEEHENM